MDHRLIVDDLARTDDPLQVDLRNADAPLNADVLKLDHLLDHRRELNEQSATVAEASDNSNQRHKANV